MSHVPPYVYVLFAVLVWLGVSRCFPRTIRIERLALMPLLMVTLALKSYSSLFPLAGIEAVLGGLAGVGLGAAIGMLHVKRWDVHVDRRTRSISLPGDIAMLAIIAGTFVFEFTVHYGIEARAAWATNALAPSVVALIWGLFVGMSAGRNLDLVRRYSAAC